MAKDDERQLASDENPEITQNLPAVRNNIDKDLARIEEKFTEVSWRIGLH